MKISTMARMALGLILVVGIGVITAHEGLDFLIGIVSFAAISLGGGLLVVAATGVLDQ